MTEIEKVSIGGYAFTLEKAAAEEVGQYLKNLEAHYLGKPGGKEIMEGIEERMAELLLERCGRGRVATMADIQSLIGILGSQREVRRILLSVVDSVERAGSESCHSDGCRT